MKKPKKVALIDVRDCPRDDYNAYWQISVIEPSAGEIEFTWKAQLLSYQPIGYAFGARNFTLAEAAAKWPGGVPKPQYPSDSHLARQAAYEKMTPEQRAEERKRQDEFRSRCAAAYAAVPQPIHLIEETLDVAANKDAADTAAQEWVRARMHGQRKKTATLHSFAGVMPMDPLADAIRDIYDALRYRWRKYVAPLLAIAYSSTSRNTQLQSGVRDLIDGGAGAGLLRAYDGSRPATCGTATTLGAELTFSDPCAGAAASGVLTMSAITADASANASITASWFRCVDSTGTCVIDGNMGTSGSDWNVNTLTITIGVQVACSSFVITGGNA